MKDQNNRRVGPSELFKPGDEEEREKIALNLYKESFGGSKKLLSAPKAFVKGATYFPGTQKEEKQEKAVMYLPTNERIDSKRMNQESM
jgi:hypothetical protein